MTTTPPSMSTVGTTPRRTARASPPRRPGGRRAEIPGRGRCRARRPAEGRAAESTTRSPRRSLLIEPVGAVGLLGMEDGAPRSDPAPVRSGISAKARSQIPLWTPGAAHGERPGDAAAGRPRWSGTVPGANRAGGTSVWIWTVTSPRRPWGLPIRATRTPPGHPRRGTTGPKLHRTFTRRRPFRRRRRAQPGGT